VGLTLLAKLLTITLFTLAYKGINMINKYYWLRVFAILVFSAVSASCSQTDSNNTATGSKSSNATASDNLQAGVKLYTVTSLPWEPQVQNTVTNTASGMHIITDAKQSDYQVSATVPVKDADILTIYFTAIVNTGGFEVGVLDQNGKWIMVKPYTKPGEHNGILTVPVSGNQTVRIIIANNNNGQSDFTITQLDVYSTKKS
jgi:hypothetical protein